MQTWLWGACPTASPTSSWRGVQTWGQLAAGKAGRRVHQPQMQTMICRHILGTHSTFNLTSNTFSPRGAGAGAGAAASLPLLTSPFWSLMTYRTIVTSADSETDVSERRLLISTSAYGQLRPQNSRSKNQKSLKTAPGKIISRCIFYMLKRCLESLYLESMCLCISIFYHLINMK